MIKTETNEDYHANPAISRSGLWTILTRSYFHYLHSSRKPTKNLDIGTAAHIAVLEPVRFNESIMRGPEDRRGNKWREAADEATSKNMILLTSPDYDDVLSMAETALSSSLLISALQGNMLFEASIYGVDAELDVGVKVRPDAVNLSKGLMIDLKTTTDASPTAFAKSVASYGYHMQQAMYMDVFNQVSDTKVDAFIFAAVEKPSEGVPPILKIYELDELSLIEGQRVYRMALDKFKEHVNIDMLSAYGDGIDTLTLPAWAYNIGGNND